MAPLERFGLSLLGKSYERVLPNRLQHTKPRLTAWPLLHPQKTIVHESGQQLQGLRFEFGPSMFDIRTPNRSAYGRGGIQSAAAIKDTELPEQRLFGRPEQVVTPGKGGAQRLLP